MHSTHIPHQSSQPSQPDSRNRWIQRRAMKPAPNTGCQNVAEYSAIVRPSSLDRSHGTNFRTHSASLLTGSSFTNIWQLSNLAICLLFDYFVRRPGTFFVWRAKQIRAVLLSLKFGFIIIINSILFNALGTQFPRAKKLRKLCKNIKLYDVLQCASVGELLQIVRPNEYVNET